MNKLLLVISLLTFSNIGLSQEVTRKQMKNSAPPINKENELQNLPMEKGDGLSFNVRDDTTGIYYGEYHTSEDTSYGSLLVHINSSLKNSLNVSTFEFIYGRPREVGRVEYSMSRTVATFGEIGDLTSIDEQSKNEILTFGIGYGYKLRMVGHLFNSDIIFDTTTASLTYNVLSQKENGKTYGGIGLKADYGIHFRQTKYMHYGFKFAYHIASLRRGVDYEGETSALRSLTVSWTTFGFDVTFYF